jgi:hypothetical protein
MAKLKKDSLLTTEHLQKLFPKKKSDITNAELLRIRRSMDDPEFDGYDLVQSLIDNQDVMNLHRCSFAQYTSAVKFCAYTMGGNVSAKDAYIRTFGHRDFVKDKVDLDKNSNKGKELSSAASRYSNSPLVQELARRESIAIYLSYRKQVHDAFGVLEDEMHNAPLSKDRIMAADRYIVHAKPPENMNTTPVSSLAAPTVDIIGDYEKAIANMAVAKLAAIRTGNDTLTMINSPVRVPIDVIDVDVVVFNPEVHDTVVYEKYNIIVERK